VSVPGTDHRIDFRCTDDEVSAHCDCGWQIRLAPVSDPVASMQRVNRAAEFHIRFRKHLEGSERA
jgi:hypothetical protein